MVSVALPRRQLWIVPTPNRMTATLSESYKIKGQTCALTCGHHLSRKHHKITEIAASWAPLKSPQPKGDIQQGLFQVVFLKLFSCKSGREGSQNQFWQHICKGEQLRSALASANSLSSALGSCCCLIQVFHSQQLGRICLVVWNLLFMVIRSEIVATLISEVSLARLGSDGSKVTETSKEEKNPLH